MPKIQFNIYNLDFFNYVFIYVFFLYFLDNTIGHYFPDMKLLKIITIQKYLKHHENIRIVKFLFVWLSYQLSSHKIHSVSDLKLDL